jgi:tRNA (guanine-N7-)-methyltransferase
MAKKKQIRFKDLSTMDFVFQPDRETILTDNFQQKGNWKSVFNNENPIILELGCGKGEYTVALAKKFPNKNFIGIDIKGARIWHGANQVREENLLNVAFVRTRIDFISLFFAENEVDEIWLTFSDPQPKKPRKRLTSRLFIERYVKFLKKDGLLHLKTDSSFLFASTLEQIELNGYKLHLKSWNIYSEMDEKVDSEMKSVLEIKTHYEKLFASKGIDIKYVKFSIDN